jgi:hypothetical protein
MTRGEEVSIYDPAKRVMTRRADVSIYAPANRVIGRKGQKVRFEIGLEVFAWEDSFALDFKYVSVVRIVGPQHTPGICA